MCAFNWDLGDFLCLPECENLRHRTNLPVALEESLPEIEANPVEKEVRKDNWPITSFEYHDPPIPESNNPWAFH